MLSKDFRVGNTGDESRQSWGNSLSNRGGQSMTLGSPKIATTAPRIAFVAAIVTLFAAGAQAETTIVPSDAQTPDQVGADTTACQTQAASQSGYHPSQPTPGASQPRAGQRLTGA